MARLSEKGDAPIIARHTTACQLRGDGAAREFSRIGRAAPLRPSLRVNEQPIILGLDTSTEARSVAVARGEIVLTTLAGEGGHNHSARILSEVDEALRRCALKVGDVELFGIASGPGSFTGLRSGMAIALAFASTLGRGVYAVPTLHAVAAAATRNNPQVIAMIPAGRGEVFAQVLSVAGDGSVVELEAPAHVSPAALLARAAGLSGRVVWCGRGMEAHAEEIYETARAHGIECVEADEDVAGEAHHGWVLERAGNSLAAVIVGMTLRAWRHGRVPGIESVRPRYVRAAAAELKK